MDIWKEEVYEMQKTMNIIEQSITPWKIAAHLTVISLFGDDRCLSRWRGGDESLL